MVSVAEVLTAEYFARGRRASWALHLRGEFSRTYMRKLREYLVTEECKHRVFPRPEHIFEALDETTLEEIKVVIIGQDPYPEPDQAHGLAFSTLDLTRPRSLCNIFAEVERNTNGRVPEGHNCLTPWARQGVLLLNRILTVRKDCANAHRGKGWECFTDKIVQTISAKCRPVVFMLWEAEAKEVAPLINGRLHQVLCWQHPVGRKKGMSRGLKGSEHFSKADQYLRAQCIEPINWLDVCKRQPPQEQDVVDALTSADADDEARWDRAFAKSTAKLERLAAEAERERRSGETEELDPSP